MPDRRRKRTVHLGQYRLTRLQVVNWGAFCGYKSIDVDERGVLLTGLSGSGKSSLLDAHSAVLLPSTDQRFNASADLTARGAKQSTRSIADYVRGAWSENHDENDQAHVQYLRGGKPTWSAVAATYDNGLGSVITAVVVKWFTGTETDGGSLKSLYQLHQGCFSLDVLEEWAARRFDTRWLKATYPPLDDPGSNQGNYVQDLARRVGLGTSKTAISLLGKAKALKNVGDLNLFIRDNMLDKPATYVAAARMVASFTPLNDAFQTAERAHRQERVLRDVPELWKQYRESQTSLNRAQQLLGEPLERYLRGAHLHAVEGELEHIDDRLEKLDETLRIEEEERKKRFNEFKLLDRQWETEAEAIRSLESALSVAEAEDGAAKASYRAYGGIVTRLQREAPTTADAFAQLKADLPRILETAQTAETDLKKSRYDVADALSEARRAYQEKKGELEALQSAPTLIPKREVARRLAIAHGVGVHVVNLPYVAELVDLAPDEERWRPAAEKVLRNYGLRLLVPEHHAATVRRFIDENDMRGIVEYNTVTATSDHQPAPRPGTLASKLIVDETHPYHMWLAAQLAQRFEHVCVETADDLDEHRLAVTVRGTLKLPGNHYRKDDREEVTNPSSYILGVNTIAKREALKAEVDTLHERRRIATEKADEHQNRLRAAENTIAAVHQLDDYPAWAVLDKWETSRRINELQHRIEAIRSENEDLQRLEKERNNAQGRHRAAEQKCAGIRNEIEALTKRMPRLVDLQESLKNHPHTVDDPGDREFLDEVLAATAAPLNPEAFQPVAVAMRRDLTARHDRADGVRKVAQTKLESSIKAFIEQWPDAAPDTSGDVERSGADFVALHDDIARRRLPEAMDRFQRLIADDMVPSISFLQREVEKSSTEIRKRITMVNEGLRRVEFNAGTRLQIAHKAQPSEDARLFRNAVDTLLRHAPAARKDADASRLQFKRVRQLMARFTSDTTDGRQWRDNILDVRNTFSFYGREEKIEDGTTVATFSNTSTNSGGEQEKLVAFCLAAALTYNLAEGTGDGVPLFAPLMLDEAFSKSDETFAAQALGVFHEFGFQLVIAAPIRMSGIIEPFIGQAVLVEKRQLPDGPRSNAASATFGQLAARRDEE
ncbi:ATP-binding protein [Micromonospora sp. NPDC048894]|uniref:ATP-binding protein n=1 Tax=Micromonospora sp. NPDC048894 TaxID=3155493 RepID=UPI0033EDD4A8